MRCLVVAGFKNLTVIFASGVILLSADSLVQASEGADFQGKQHIIDRHSKPLPHRQYQIEELNPNSDAAVVFNEPETTTIEIKPLNPAEYQRLVDWKNEWDRINRNQLLVSRYFDSYQAAKDEDYLQQASSLQQQAIKDLTALEAIAWPNSDYAYKAHREKLRACQRLNDFLNIAEHQALGLASGVDQHCNQIP